MDQAFRDHRGGTLEFVMGDRPNREWGNDPAVFEQLTADN